MANLSKELSEGMRASALLENEEYKHALATIREGIHVQWEKSPIRDEEGQKQLKLMLKLLNDLEANIRIVAQTGKLAKIQIEQEQEKVDKLKFWRR